MSFQRRQVLQWFTCALWSTLFVPKLASAIAEQSTAASDNASRQLKSVAKSGEPGSAKEKVAGIGGFFFRAHDPAGLANWYLEHLGVALTPTNSGGRVWQQEAGPTAVTPFPETSHYVGDPQKTWMLNFRVHNLDKMAAQLREAGIEVKLDPESYPYGRFARLHDPEGNPIELWQPA